jgi:flagellar hook-length control protein FliK
MILFPELMPEKGARLPVPQAPATAGLEFFAVLRSLENALASGPQTPVEPTVKAEDLGETDPDIDVDTLETVAPEAAFEAPSLPDNEADEPIQMEHVADFKPERAAPPDQTFKVLPRAEDAQPPQKPVAVFAPKIEPLAAVGTTHRPVPVDPAAWDAPKAGRALAEPEQNMPLPTTKSAPTAPCAPVPETAKTAPEFEEHIARDQVAARPQMPEQVRAAPPPRALPRPLGEAQVRLPEAPTLVPENAPAKPAGAEEAPRETAILVAADPKPQSAPLLQTAPQMPSQRAALPEPHEHPTRIEAGKPMSAAAAPEPPLPARGLVPRSLIQPDAMPPATPSPSVKAPIAEGPAAAPSDLPEVSISAHALPFAEVDAPAKPSAHSPMPAIDRPETPRAIAVQVAEAFKTSDGDSISIRLDPEELGAVRMKLNHNDTQIIVSISAERPETLDLMRRHVDQLAQEMRGLGYASLRFDFQQQNQRNGQPSQASMARQSEPEAPSVSPFCGPRQGAAAGGLDIRL